MDKLIRTKQSASIIENLPFKRVDISPGQELKDVIIYTPITDFPEDIFPNKVNVLCLEENSG